MTSTQEVLKNARDGRTRTELLDAAVQVRWTRQLGQLWISDNLCIGGWSFLRPSRKLTRHYVQATVLGLLGWLWVVSARTRPAPPLFRSPGTGPACAILCLSYTAALAYHTVHSQLAWGIPTTNPWYAAAALPWFVMLVAVGAMCWPLGRLRCALPALLAGLFVTSEAVMAWGQMATTYTGGAGGWLALRRLASLQPAFLGTATLLVATAGAVVAFATAAARCGEAWLRPDESPIRPSAIYRPHLFDIADTAPATGPGRPAECRFRTKRAPIGVAREPHQLLNGAMETRYRLPSAPRGAPPGEPAIRGGRRLRQVLQADIRRRLPVGRQIDPARVSRHESSPAEDVPEGEAVGFRPVAPEVVRVEEDLGVVKFARRPSITARFGKRAWLALRNRVYSASKPLRSHSAWSPGFVGGTSQKTGIPGPPRRGRRTVRGRTR